MTRNVPHLKFPPDALAKDEMIQPTVTRDTSTDDDEPPRRSFRSTSDVGMGKFRVDLSQANLMHEISYPYYEIDKELTGCKRRFDED